MSDSIYRFINFPSFVDAIQRRSLAFVTYDVWDDPYEGYVFGAMKIEKGRNAIATCLREMRYSMPPDFVMGILSNMRHTVHLQSWSRLPESDALWRIYGFGGSGIRIETTRKKMLSIQNLSIVDVEYRTLTLEEELRKICSEESKIDVSMAFSSKRKEFEHEQEVRVVTGIDLEKMSGQSQPIISREEMSRVLKEFQSRGELTLAQVEEGMRNFDKEEKKQNGSNKVKQISFATVPDFISSVVVNPTAADWFVEMVEEFCDRNKLPFKGKSALYTFSHQ